MNINEISREIVTTINGTTFSSNEEFVEKVTNIIKKKLNTIIADENSCGFWCPLCGAHLYAPKN